MATIADELNAISVEHGYTGAAPKTIAGAIDALADTLAGTDVEGRRTIAGAVKALAPYIGSGGGGSLGELQLSPLTTGYDDTPPVVGEAMPPMADGMAAFDLLMGETTVAYNVDKVEKLSAGLNVNLSCSAVNSAYMVAYSFGESNEPPTVTEVAQFSDYTFDDGVLSFTMPVVPQPDGDNNFRNILFYLTWG